MNKCVRKRERHLDDDDAGRADDNIKVQNKKKTLIVKIFVQ